MYLHGQLKHSSAGHVVVVPDLRNDFRATGAIVARLVGAFLTSVPSMLAQKPSGVQFVTDVTKKKRRGCMWMQKMTVSLCCMTF